MKKEKKPQKLLRTKISFNLRSYNLQHKTKRKDDVFGNMNIK